MDLLSVLQTILTRITTPYDTDDLQDATACTDVLAFCDHIETAARRIRSDARQKLRSLVVEIAPVKVMAEFISQEMTKEPAVVKVNSIAGGTRSAALRRADGRCELCGYEFNLGVHHIIPRVEGGLNDPDNLIVLCKPCHNDIEDQGYRTREAIKRHVAEHSLMPKTDSDSDSHAHKIAATKASKAARAVEGAIALTEWASQYGSTFWNYVPYVKLGDTPPRDPDWYVYVYGSGRHKGRA